MSSKTIIIAPIFLGYAAMRRLANRVGLGRRPTVPVVVAPSVSPSSEAKHGLVVAHCTVVALAKKVRTNKDIVANKEHPVSQLDHFDPNGIGCPWRCCAWRLDLV